MAKKATESSKTKLKSKIRTIVKREGGALFILISIAAGTAAFVVVATATWDIKIVDWKWIAIINSLIRLPETFAELKRSREPWLIRFARGFQKGFLSTLSIIPDASKWVTKLRGWFKNMSKK